MIILTRNMPFGAQSLDLDIGIVKIRLSNENLHTTYLTKQESIDGVKAWMLGEELIQDALPHWTPSQREMLLTGMSDEEWDELFPPEADSEDE